MKGFLNTSVTNILVTGALSFLAIFRPETIRNVNISFLLWLSSGFVMLVMLFVKISLFRRIYGRAQDPANYHLNFFGKKVLHPTVVKAEEVLIFFITIPFFLFAGAYFIARLVNLMMFGRL